MINQKIVIIGIMLTEMIPFENNFVQYGALGILITLLIYYSFANYKENIRKEKVSEQARKDLIDSHEKEKEILRGQLTELYGKYLVEINNERERYNNMNREILVLLQNKLK